MLKTFTVLYRNNNIGPLEQPFGFTCEAEDGDHAEEQCLNAEPDADIVWVGRGGYQASLHQYWNPEEAEAKERQADDIEQMVEDALNAACLAIQDRLGVTDGGTASIFFTGDNEDTFRKLMRSYIQAEQVNL